jgi:hypothetical protein
MTWIARDDTVLRRVAAGAGLLGLLAALGGCAEGSATTSLVPTATATAAAPAAAPAAAAPAAAADKPAKAPEHLTAAQINEQCWLTPEINKIPDLDKRLKLVDKCVDQKTKAQGGL